MDAKVHQLPVSAPAPAPAAGFDQDRLARLVDPQVLIATFRRHMKVSLAIAAVVFVAVAVFTLQATPKYTATASVLLDPRKQKVTGIEDVLSGLPADSSTVDTEVEVLKSRALAERVVTVLKLDQDPDFNPALKKPGLIAGLMGRGGPATTATLSDLEIQKRREKIVDNVLSNLKVSRAGLTYMIKVSYENKDPQKATAIANAFADRYLLEQLEAKFEATRTANEWLNGRLAELRVQVQTAEAAVEQFKAANGLLSTGSTTLTEQEISNLNQQLAAARVQQVESEARLQTARAQLARGSTGEDVGEALGSRVVQELRSQRAAVSGRVADLEGRYGGRHPEILKAQRELADIDGQIRAEISRIISNLEAQAEVQRQRTASLAGSLANSRGTLAGNNRASVRLRELERNAESVRSLYESFLGRFKETSAQEGIEQSDARVVSRARIPTEPSSPNLPLNLALGLVLALGAGVGATVLREMLDTGLATADDVEQQLGLPYLAGVPILASTLDRALADEAGAPVDHVVDKPLSSFAEAFRNLKTSLQFAKLGEPLKVIALTSSLPDEGKTTTTLCLARTLAMSGAKVVVVDCDLRRRAVNDELGLDPEKGLIELLAGKAKLADVLVDDTRSSAKVLPLAKHAYTPKDVFGSVAMTRLLAELKASYDYVLLDTAPVLAVAETRALAPKADAVALLVRWRKTPRKATESALRMLQNGQTFVAGAVLTQIDQREQSSYGYGDPSYYHRSYAKYYAE
ncbi:polysaccharide biosynthesis tyrosine autokinase [Caulobacter sp. 17J80-11]|uniref:GumC family protein n=1 Tax=Caulobacter sp. 17J80-11 TaxID=2763502 RepID=UPI0016537346|nr:polysaccharide biosynthesis tyrosine autokinase [Caulobacter sp. 17J80-11]MBC6982486.1 polysaccharide biosynthesis tyrosine autokinase [Caulobacter sp. 17J80-11]